jgi:hypothetical protein
VSRVTIQSAIQHRRFDVEQRLRSRFGPGNSLLFAKTLIN